VKRLLLALTVVAAVAIPVCGQQQVPALEKGFQADKLYQFNGLDNVGIFNGNLVVTIPIGMSYPLNGGLSYQLTLSYNSTVWDLEDAGGKVHAFPSRRSNAGTGWLIGTGRLIAADDPTNQSNLDTYEAPDGGDHSFNSATGSCGAGCGRTTDGSNLRLRFLSSTVRELDAPDGTIRHFEKITGTTSWELKSIRGPRSTDAVTFTTTYSNPPSQCPGASMVWTISDSFQRNHYVCFKNHSVDGVAKPMVDSVVLAGPSAAGSPNVPQAATYTFTYTDNVLFNAPPSDNDYDNLHPRTHTAPELTSINLPSTSTADQASFAFTYGGDNLSLLTLPTGGTIAYTYTDYLIPGLDICAYVTEFGQGFGGSVRGIFRRTLTPAVAAGEEAPVPQVWQYQPDRAMLASPRSLYLSQTNCTVGSPSETHVELWDEHQVTVTDPSGNKVVNHFSVWQKDWDRTNFAISPGGVNWLHYGYPYGKKAADGLYLSQEFFRCDTGTCVLKRSKWVRHEMDLSSYLPLNEPLVPHRLAEERTSFHDDPSGCSADGGSPPCAWTRTLSTDWDNLGHYRTVTTTGNINTSSPVQRTSTTSWNKVNGAARTIAPTDPWLPDTFESVTTTEGTQTVVAQSCFDLTTGFLKGWRQLLGTAPAGNDLLTVYGKDADGNLNTEKYYGGDLSPLTANQSNLCDALASLSGTPQYGMTHTWQYGRPSTSKYDGLVFLANDATIDRSGVVLSARDTAGLQTAYSYDRNGRLLSVQPPTGPPTNYVYKSAIVANAALTRPAQVKETTVSTSAGTLEREYHFDALGRLWREKNLVPAPSGTGTIWTMRETLYDGHDRKKSISEVTEIPASTNELTFHPSQRSVFDRYDPFGRVEQVTATDGSVSTVSYTGARTVTRTSQGGGIVAAPVTLVEEYDSFGRLIAVKENSGPTGGLVTTTYGYDVGNRLNSVHMAGTEGIVQNRTFDYDGRGLLRWESQPESGMASYTYDARGHVRSRIQGAAMSPFDLLFGYDLAERPTITSGRDPLNPNQWRPIKLFQYGDGNDPGPPINYAKGKLTDATRFNYPPNPNGGGLPNKMTEGVLRVDESYYYRDAAGRRTDKITDLAWQAPDGQWLPTFRSIQQSFSYNDIGLPATVWYPQCQDCGMPPHLRLAITNTYETGALKHLNDFVTNVTYWPNGMRKLLVHDNQISDTQTVHASGMPRPGLLSSGIYDTCTSPTIVQISPDGFVSSTTPSLTLSATVTGTSPLVYQWYNNDTGQSIPGATSASYVASPSVTTNYRLQIANNCKVVDSMPIKVTVGNCVDPWISSAVATRNPNGTFTLSGVAGGKTPFTFKWYDASGTTLLATATTYTTPVLSVTTAYVLEVSNSCGGTAARRNVYAGLSPDMPVSVLATRTGNTQITVTWMASAGATGYEIERRDAGVWTTHGTSISNQYIDQNLAVDTTYVYRVIATGPINGRSDASIPDLATTMVFTPVQSGGAVNADHFTQLLAAVNAVRAAAGWAPVTWTSILTANDPVPLPSKGIVAQQIVSLRARMNEAIHAVGVPVNGYTDSDPRLGLVRAAHITELQGRAQ
jgi:YD repeat-containing protein